VDEEDGGLMYVVATAGHVDHGKSTLVRALTGMEPDRWAEERRRGMTIDLGYAWMTLPPAASGGPGAGTPGARGPGEKLAFVDVPGHERFVPNMLAGLGPVPAVMFIVAADGGWMPQSAEHLAAVNALGVRHGLLVITRSDLADPGPATREALAEIARTSLGIVEAIPVSAVTGQGLDDLKAALVRLVASLNVSPERAEPESVRSEPRETEAGQAGISGAGAPDIPAISTYGSPDSPVRLWIDRSFTIRGAGTVVTGTLPAGTVRNGQELLLVPAGRPVRVRGLEALGEPAAAVTGVARVALNLRGIPADLPGRGMALVDPGRWTLTSEVDVRVTPMAADPNPKFPPDLLVHIGSARTGARVRVLGADPSAGPGSPGLGEAGLGSPGVGAAGPESASARSASTGSAGPAAAGPGAASARSVSTGPVSTGSFEPGAADAGSVSMEAAGPEAAGPGAAGPGAASARSVSTGPVSTGSFEPGAADAGSVSMEAAGPAEGEDTSRGSAAIYARLRLKDPLPLHVGDRVILRDPGAAGLAIYGARVLDPFPPPLARRGAGAAAVRELSAWPDLPRAADLLRRHKLVRAPQLAAAGVVDLPAPVAGDWLADPAHWAWLRAELPKVVAAFSAKDPLAPGMPAEAARAALGLPSRDLVPALAGEDVVLDGAYLRIFAKRAPEPGGTPGSTGTGSTGTGVAGATGAESAADSAKPAGQLPPRIAEGVQAVLDGLAGDPFAAPDTERLRALGLDARALAAAARVGLLLRIADLVVLAPGADREAARVLAGLDQPFTTSQARQALHTSRRVAIPLLEHLDRTRVTERLPGDLRRLRS
jgi:selenocysteine-specific elongation factor